ncbi:MAG: antibiotic biosynthesis monooxygenase [Actinomycetota bacterium]|nr:antibiotic biosynthesis monooxygenase [Actinomycetota bacterium]
MYVRITTLRVSPENIPRVETLTRQSFLPAAQREEGFQAMIVSSSPEDRKMVVITLWESEEHMRRSRESESFQEQLSRIITLLSGPPETIHMRVALMS